MVSLGGLARKLFGSAFERRVKSLRPKVAEINALEEQFKKLRDSELRQKSDE